MFTIAWYPGQYKDLLNRHFYSLSEAIENAWAGFPRSLTPADFFDPYSRELQIKMAEFIEGHGAQSTGTRLRQAMIGYVTSAAGRGRSVTRCALT